MLSSDRITELGVRIKTWMKHVSTNTYIELLQEVFTISWSPTGVGSENPNQQLLLAR